MFLAYRDVQRAIRDDRWKLIVYPQVNHRQLFDLTNDPHELHDLAGDARHAQEVERLTKLLRAAQAEVGDTQPLTVANPQPRTFDFSKVK